MVIATRCLMFKMITLTIHHHHHHHHHTHFMQKTLSPNTELQYVQHYSGETSKITNHVKTSKASQ